MSADPREALEDLDQEDECVYISGRTDAYIWRDPDDDEVYHILEQTRSGSWLPHPRPISIDDGAAIMDGANEYDIEPQRKIPDGAHQNDT